MLVIYIDKQTNRLGYTINLLFKDVLGVEFMVTTSKETFIAEKGAKLSYSASPIYDEIHITSKSLLFETSLSADSVETVEKEGIPCLFPNYNKNDSLGFDIFAASFYMVSRYEEYLPFKIDKHGRFTAKESIAYREGFLEKPIVNIWAGMLKSKLLEKYPDTEFRKTNFSFVNTIDIDMAYYYKHKGFYRNLGGSVRDVLHRDFNSIRQRFRVLFLGKQDPYMCNDFIQTINTRYGIKTLLFYLFASRTDYDKSISPYNRAFQLTVKDMADYCKIGIHPSYYVMEDASLLPTQKKLLENIIHKKVFRSRFHYLRFRLPQSYRTLIENEITDDYSMGYADCVGFRAGIATPYNFYDLERDNETKLRIHPFALMDVSLKNGMKLNKTQAKEKIFKLVDEVRQVGGEFISIWHNESLSNYKAWQGWRKIYELELEYILNKS